MDEYRERLQKVLECVAQQPEADIVREVRLRIALGHAVWYSAIDADRMEDAFTRALEVAEAIEDRSAQLQSLWGMWAMLRSRGAYKRALEVAGRYEEVAIGFGDPQFISLANRILNCDKRSPELAGPFPFTEKWASIRPSHPFSLKGCRRLTQRSKAGTTSNSWQPIRI
jgi:hypothetical protein